MEYRRPLSVALEDYINQTDLISRGLHDCIAAAESIAELPAPACGCLFACIIVAREYWRLRGEGLAEHLADMLRVGVEERGIREGLGRLLRKLEGMGLEDGLPGRPGRL